MPAESCTVMTELKTPVIVVVPEKSPDAENLIPSGSVGGDGADGRGAIENVYGGVPPTAVSCCAYAWVAMAFRRLPGGSSGQCPRRRS